MRRWAFWLFCISLGLRFLSIGASLLWYDEAFTAYVIKLPFVNMLQAIAGDTHPPLWYLIEWGVSQLFGRSEIALRSPAALFGSGAVVVLYLLVDRLAGQTPARWASALMAIMPAQLYYSQEARMYSLLTLLVLFGAYSIVCRKWLRVGLALALIPFTQNVGLLYAGLLGVWLLWETRLRGWRYLLIPAAAYLPQAVIMAQQVTSVGAGFWVPDPDNLGAILYNLHFITFFVRIPEPFKLHSAIVVLSITAITLYSLRNSATTLLPLIGLAFLPPILLYAVSELWHPVMVDRTMLPAGAALVGLWGVALSKLPAWAKPQLAAVGVPFLLVNLIAFYADPIQQRKFDDPIPALIRDNWRPGDAVYHTQFFTLIQYDYYIAELPAYTLPFPGTLRAGLLTDESQAAMGITAREIPIAKLAALGYRRVWLVADESVVTSQYGIDFRLATIRRYHVVKQWAVDASPLNTITLYLLELV